MTKTKETGANEDFLDTLERGVRNVLRNKDATASEKVAAITSGVKIAMVRHKISGSDEKGFFE